MIQFTFRGKRSYDDFGVVMQSKDRTVLPEKRRKRVRFPAVMDSMILKDRFTMTG